VNYFWVSWRKLAATSIGLIVVCGGQLDHRSISLFHAIAVTVTIAIDQILHAVANFSSRRWCTSRLHVFLFRRSAASIQPLVRSYGVGVSGLGPRRCGWIALRR